ncbi:MAG TPA: hypothetical protein VNL71_07890 [Chloroflexota bacterium]|nr:hypothetical protein [Chloroflexota bacterium]
MIDRAQDRMSQAGNQAARVVQGAARVRALEARQGDLRRQIEDATIELGKLTFQRWKNGGVGNDDALAGACRRIDGLNAEYQQLLHDLIEARAAMPALSTGQGLPPSYPYATPSLPPPQAPAQPYPPYSGSPLAPPYSAADPSLSQQAGPPGGASFPPAAGWRHVPDPALSPPPRIQRAARECPECYSMVPGSADYCPSCGMRI